jgi:hypothetical protein
MDRCPCCNARLTEAVFCPRCQADLSSVLGSEQMARHWLNNALQFWVMRESQMAILALTKSVNLKKIPAALVFRDFIIRQQCQNVLRLLTNKDYAKAKEALLLLRNLNPDNQFIIQLHGFTQYLLTNTSGKIIHPVNNGN